ncbi:MAG: hypothetical protein U0798_04030 [Gemmataceae bacterium]
MELIGARFLILFVIFFIISCFSIYTEMVYFFRGRVTVAQVSDVRDFQTTDRRGRSSPSKKIVLYEFTEPNGEQRKGSDEINLGWKRTQTVKVQYTPGANGRSRIAGNVNWLGVGFFGFSIILMAAALLLIWISYVRDHRQVRIKKPQHFKQRRFKKTTFLYDDEHE